ncbi:alpha-ketoglutarate-dependent dioxygenase AlkB family protein [Primorskyibacter sedentarius]|uniref:Alkylated DNA repair protein (DNA oxidative demethylase) n=1 Tax=Primorskyibacter sedentarius TaxID=745311 RepID=A0A4V2UPK8_9RHOB|nr:alpha-ketoglutarate-dependent dioxygenase AlkB [Primorskyibacter sedentarius]TCS66206.1 alkylated DNA repair protein (DNA oxidative demethylase) [Primorskyibacter sedentarius]
MKPTLMLREFAIYQGYLDRPTQDALVNDIREIVAAAPLFSPETRWGKKMSVRMTSAGRFGWISDRSGYRYAEEHPQGMAWPPIPDRVMNIWNDLSQSSRSPECCLVNWYGEGARMGLHQDRDEADFTCPVVSVSLGDEGLFRVGTQERKGSTESVWLKSGDVVVMGGAARLTHHGVDRIRFGSSSLLPQGGRLNLTLRVVT